MATLATHPSLNHFAVMLDYPGESLPETAAACAELLRLDHTAAASLVDDFAGYAARTALPSIEEAYTGVFDLDPKCAPYIGYHLFGESYKRSIFLLGLNERFDAQRFTPPGDLPDHLAVVLRCLTTADDDMQAQELIVDAVLPALDRMTGRIKAPDFDESPESVSLPDSSAARRAPFVDLLEALRLVLRVHLPDEESPELASTASSTSTNGGSPHG